MKWRSANWIWVVVVAAFVGLHFFGHMGHMGGMGPMQHDGPGPPPSQSGATSFP